MECKLLTYWEHYNSAIKEEHQNLLSQASGVQTQYNFQKKRGVVSCYSIEKKEGFFHLETSYFVGVDWLLKDKLAIYIEPKLNKHIIEQDNSKEELVEVDYLKMMFEVFPYIENSQSLDDLFQIKWKEPEIQITQQQDVLTPLLVIQFLSLLKIIVKKGLKKNYYKVTKNLNSRVKGKVLIGQTIKQNHLKNRPLQTYCNYEEFGVDILENRILKKTLTFIKQYLPLFKGLDTASLFSNAFNFVTPAFTEVSDDIDVLQLKTYKKNVFYKEYTEAIRLAKLILSRFGYNISNAQKSIISTPPFWVDMSKLFEYYVLGLLKNEYPNQKEIEFQFLGKKGHELDFLLNRDSCKMIIDTKYKPKYKKDTYIEKEDFRQLSGYSRLKKVYDTLSIDYDKVIDCLIIYPDLDRKENNFKDLKCNEIKDHIGFYKLGVNIPLIVNNK